MNFIHTINEAYHTINNLEIYKIHTNSHGTLFWHNIDNKYLRLVIINQDHTNYMNKNEDV